MDICYFLGSESRADDWELRYSMRSWRTNFQKLGAFHIVGHKPAWLADDCAGVHHHPFPDSYRHNKDANLIQKALYLAASDKVSDPFVLCSDDQMLLQLIGRWEWPQVFLPRSHSGRISEFKKRPGHSWWERLHRTGAALRRRGFTDFHFDTHIPHVVYKKEVWPLLQWNFGEGNGYCVFSLMFNTAGVEGGRLDRSPIRAGLYGSALESEVIDWKLKQNLFLSIDDDSLQCARLVRAVEALFPVAAPWEAYQPTPIHSRTPMDASSPHGDASSAFDLSHYTIT